VNHERIPETEVVVAVIHDCYLGMKAWSLEMSKGGYKRNAVERFPGLEIGLTCSEEHVGSSECIVSGW
jgi:hypothetical protein